MNPLINDTSTTSKRSIWPEKTRGLWVKAAEHSRLILSDGWWYDDWASALGANTLGYYRFGNLPFRPATSLPWSIENEFAGEFCQAMGTEAVRFFKSGSDAVSCAVRLARGFTDKKNVIVFNKSYHGTGDWFGGNLWTRRGIADTIHLFTRPFGKELKFKYPDLLETTAAIVVEPVPKAIDLPPAGWLQHLREVCDEHGILLVADQVILGYRHTLAGYPGDGGPRFDLLCYGKAMAQGAALSACTGRYDVMSLLAKEVHFSGTNNGEPLPLQIAQWTLREYQEKKVCEILTAKGETLKFMLTNENFKTRGLLTRFEIIFDSPKAKMDCTRFCFEHGILFPGFCSMAVSHTTDQMTRLVDTLKKWRDK
jgi:glutamate-1-semialdehyde aminotransferase